MTPGGAAHHLRHVQGRGLSGVELSLKPMIQKLNAPVELNVEGRALLRLLVGQLPAAKAQDPRTFLTYKGVHDALKLPQLGPTFGESLKHQGLTNLADWTALTGMPGITGLIVDSAKLSPGDGYFGLFGRQKDDFLWWMGEVTRSKNFDWTPYLEDDDALFNRTNDEWSDEELRGAVNAYLEMQHLTREGAGFTKKHYYDALAGTFDRTAKAFEYRMQNISYVLTLMGRGWLTGLKPAKNVGGKVAEKIERFIAEAEQQVFAPVVGFELAVREGRKKKPLAPKGIRAPLKTMREVTQFQRDPSVKAWVLENAKGICEACDQPAPFNDSDDVPFLEVHHVRKLAENGSDTITNAAAICPNCHRAMHFGIRAKELVDALYLKVKRLVLE